MIETIKILNYKGKNLQSEYDYETETLVINGKTRNMKVDTYKVQKDNTIKHGLGEGYVVELLHDGVLQKLPKYEYEKVSNYKIMCKKGGRFEGIQGFTEDDDIVTGGNVIYHLIAFNKTKEAMQKQVESLEEGYPKYQFKFIKV